MKVVILGGSAPSTPALWSYLNHNRLDSLHVVLIGRHGARLAAVVRACQLLTESSTHRLEYRTLEDSAAWTGLADAAVFLIQIRNGGYAARAMDETFPLRYGACGDEGLGPGGLAAGIRNWRVIQPLLKQISRTAPAAQVMLMSSPVSLLVRAAKHVFPKLHVSGICELPWTTLLQISSSVGVPANAVHFDYLGVNHLGWFHRLEFDGKDLIQKYRTVCARESAFPSAAIIEECTAVPLAHLKLHYERTTAIDDQRKDARPRGEFLAEWSNQAFDVYANGTRADIECILEQRPSPWYPYAIGPFIGFLAGRKPEQPFFLSVPNNDAEPQFDPDDILECAYAADSNGLRRLRLRSAVPPRVMKLLTQFVRYERIGVEALLTGEHGCIEAAIGEHPWTRDLPDRTELARAIAGR